MRRIATITLVVAAAPALADPVEVVETSIRAIPALDLDWIGFGGSDDLKRVRSPSPPSADHLERP